MIKLKNIVTSLDNSVYEAIESSLLKNKADNFLFLLRAFRENKMKDKEIIEGLQINDNSFYVLKSRLHDKIQEHLSGNIYASKEEVVKQLHLIPEMCMTAPRDVTISFLQKMEKDLLQHDMHNELVAVYSAFKKVHTFSDKYFYYSQLYNKHIAYSLSLEKSFEILGNFNRVLGQYHFSRSTKLLDTLLFLRKGIGEHYTLNPSKPIELIQNIIELQLRLLAGYEKDTSKSTEEILRQTQKIIDDSPDSSEFITWLKSINYLYFEYYYKIKQYSLAQSYFEKVDADLTTLLLSNNVCVNALFLSSKLSYLQELNQQQAIINDYKRQMLYDASDTHSAVLIGLYNAMVAYYNGKLKEASNVLNELLNMNSFKDYFHVNTEIRLTLVFIYLQMEEFDLSDNILKNIYRKIKTEKLEQYNCLLDLIKVFGEDVKKLNTKVTAKQKDFFTLFMARNVNEHKMLKHLVLELNKKYT